MVRRWRIVPRDPCMLLYWHYLTSSGPPPTYLPTCNAAVGGVQVRFELVVARRDSGLEEARHREAAGRSAGTVGVETGEDVRSTARLSVAHLNAPAAAHPAVLGGRHDNHLPGTSTTGVERLRQAVFAADLVILACTRRHNSSSKAPSTPATVMKPHRSVLQDEGFFRQSLATTSNEFFSWNFVLSTKSKQIKHVQFVSTLLTESFYL